MTQTYILQHTQPFIAENWDSGFQEPTVIQEKAAQVIMEGKDVIAESPTGTGKHWRTRFRFWSGSTRNRNIRK